MLSQQRNTWQSNTTNSRSVKFCLHSLPALTVAPAFVPAAGCSSIIDPILACCSGIESGSRMLRQHRAQILYIAPTSSPDLALCFDIKAGLHIGSKARTCISYLAPTPRPDFARTQDILDSRGGSGFSVVLRHQALILYLLHHCIQVSYSPSTSRSDVTFCSKAEPRSCICCKVHFVCFQGRND